MDMERITDDGVTYVKASVLARDLGYTADYVGQLCRAQKVDAKLVGRTWYVSEEELRKHKDSRYRSSKAVNKREVRRILASSAEEETAPPKFYRHASATTRYEPDEAELLPVTKKGSGPVTKLSVELADAKPVEVRSETSHYNFETPKREEVQFHGTLKVEDAEITLQKKHDQEERLVPVEEVQGARARKVRTHTEKKTAFRSKIRAVEEKQASVQAPKQTHRHSGTLAVAPQAVEDEATSPYAPVAIYTTSVILAGAVAFAIFAIEAQLTITPTSIAVSYSFGIPDVLAQIYVAMQ